MERSLTRLRNSEKDAMRTKESSISRCLKISFTTERMLKSEMPSTNSEQNRKITDIQRNFLKRLLMSKAGMVVIAFRKIQTLPERRDNEAYAKANKFEKGLELNSLTELSRNHSKLSRMNGKKVKLSRREQLFNSSMPQWEDKRKCTTDGTVSLKEQDL
jgi:hypothetical protein